MNKRAAFFTTEELIIWVPRIIILAVALGLIISLVTIPIRKSFEIDELQQVILRQRFVYSDTCLAYREGERVYPGIIDINKFNIKNLEDCFQANDKTGVSLVLKTNDVKSINLNLKIAEKSDFCFDKKHFACSNYTYYVLIKDKTTYPALLNIAMVKLK